MACGFIGHSALAQEGTGTGATSPSGTSPSGASSSFGSPSTPNPASPFGSPSAPTPATPTAPSFRTGEAPATPGGPNDRTGAAPGAASAFGTEQPGAGLNRTPPASFTVPGFYGRGSQQFVVGEGRLARPRFRYHGSLSTGYDDNVFQTPTHGPSAPEQKVQILVAPAVPTTNAFVTVPSGDPLVPDSDVLTEIPGSKAKFRTQTIPAVPAAERKSSWVTRASAGFDVQMANRRNLFTFDLDAGDNYYWDRPGKKSDYNGSVSLVYLRKLTGRAQFTMTLGANYQTEPDFSQPNQPTSNQGGSHLSVNAKADLSYRLTPRFSSVTSVSYTSLHAAEKTQRSGDYGETTFGTELRYLFSPRLTLLGELRYSSSMHQDDIAQDTTSYFLLVGGELTLTRRFSASVRLGETMQTYTEGGSKSSSPYLEATLDYRLARATTVQWNARYGFENSGNSHSQSTVARSGLVLTQIFSPRLQGSLSLNLIHNSISTTSEVAVTPVVAPTAAVAPTPAPTTPVDPNAPVDPAATPTATPAPSPTPAPKAAKPVVPRTKTIVTATTQDTIDATAGLHYTFDRHWSFNLNYTYTMSIGPQVTADYYRQQIFLGAEFQF